MATLSGPACSDTDETKAAGGNFYLDADQDGYGTGDRIETVGEVRKHTGRLAKQPGDCNDADPLINPSQADIDPNGKDDDCDGVKDFMPAPKVDKPRVKTNSGGKTILTPDSVEWHEMVTAVLDSTRREDFTKGQDLSIKGPGVGISYGLAKGGVGHDREKQEELWAWARPHVEAHLKAYSPEEKGQVAVWLQAAEDYAAMLADPDYRETEDIYLAALQSTDCTDLFPDKEDKSCSRFFNHYGPYDSWDKAIESAKARAGALSEEDKRHGFVFIGNIGPETERELTLNRELQTGVYRRLGDGISPEDLKYWTGAIREDLSLIVGEVQ
ncbi:MAG: putative metal-binding motif-containing protein [Candidatus Gracilibacteria bacterium]